MSIRVESPVVGTVWRIQVAIGDAVSEGEDIMILESMKMEIPVLATEAGTIAEFQVEEAEPVAEGQVVVVLDT